MRIYNPHHTIIAFTRGEHRTLSTQEMLLSPSALTALARGKTTARGLTT
jgi:hypothetical protein